MSRNRSIWGADRTPDTIKDAEAAEHSGELQALADAIQETANRKRSETQKGIPKAEKEPSATTSGKTFHAGSEAKAVASKSNRGTVERMDQLLRKRTDLSGHQTEG